MNWYIRNLTGTGKVNAHPLNISGKNTLFWVFFLLSVLYSFSQYLCWTFWWALVPLLWSLPLCRRSGWHGPCQLLGLCENVYPPFLLFFFIKTDFNLVLIKPPSSLALSGLRGCSVGSLTSEVPHLSSASPEMMKSAIYPGWTSKCCRNLNEGEVNFDLTLNYFN